MKVININTKELIEETGDFPGIYWTTPEYWLEYKEWCKVMQDKQNKAYYGKVQMG